MLLQSLTLLLGKENLDFNRYPSFPTLLVTLWSRNFPRIHLEDSHLLPWKKGFQVFVWYCLHCLQEGTWRDLKLLGHDSFNKCITALQNILHTISAVRVILRNILKFSAEDHSKRVYAAAVAWERQQFWHCANQICRAIAPH